jgi:REP element-mobilizing transposase RayT
MSQYDPDRYHRRSIRLKGYDYAQAGAYFVTLCTQERACLFGEVVDGEMRLDAGRQIVRQCWAEIPIHFPRVALDAFVVMPNHVHGIIILTDDMKVGARHAEVGARHAVPQQTERFGQPVAGSIPTVIRSLKSAVAYRLNALRGTPDTPVWQRNYYEHIIRNERALIAIRAYILKNPIQWAVDCENPQRRV